MGLLYRGWALPLSSHERNCYCFGIPRHFGQFHAPNFVETVWGWGFLFQHDCALVHKARSVKALQLEFGVEEFDWPVQIPDLNLMEDLWNELETLLNWKAFPEELKLL